jgi:hypothetical protein
MFLRSLRSATKARSRKNPGAFLRHPVRLKPETKTRVHNLALGFCVRATRGNSSLPEFRPKPLGLRRGRDTSSLSGDVLCLRTAQAVWDPRRWLDRGPWAGG